MFGLPPLPLDAFPFIAFALGTAGIVAAKIWSWNLDRKERHDHSEGPDFDAFHAPATSQVAHQPHK